MKRENIETIYELSPLQQGILLHTLAEPQSGMYVQQFSWTIQGALNVPALERAWQLVVDRHAILRTSFHWEALDKPVQVVHRQATLPIDRYDDRELTPEQQRARFDNWLKEARDQGTDLSKAPLMRLFLERVADELYQCAWSFHHILLDGWSVPRVHNEVLSAYRAIAEQREPQFRSSQPYRRFIGWLQQQDASAAEAFWRDTLRGFDTPALIAGDRAAAPRGSDDECPSLKTALSAEVTASLQAMARQQRLTLSTIVEGTWALLLARTLGLRDVVFGVISSGREIPLDGVDSMIGLLINTMPLRVRIASATPVAEWLREIQRQHIEARRFEYCGLTDIHRWSEVPSGQPLFDSILAYENYPIDAAPANPEHALQLANFKILFDRTNYPLSVIAAPGPQLSLRLMYDPRRVETPMVERLLRRFEVVLGSIAAQPERPLGDLSMLTDEEQQQILVDWNDTETEFPREACIQALFEEQVLRAPNAEALRFGSTSVTYAELNTRANQLAHHLRASGVGADTLVGVCMERSADMVMAFVAILKAGGAYVPLDPQYPKDRLAFMVADTAVPVLLTDDQSMSRLPEHRSHVINVSAFVPDSSTTGANPPSVTTADNLAYVVYTSGSTGIPKGIGIPHRGVTRLVLNTNYIDLGPTERIAQASNSSFDAATFEIWGALLKGGCLVGISRDVALAAREFGAEIRDKGVTTLFLTTALFNQMAREVPWAFNSLRHLLFGGEAVDVASTRQALEQGHPTRLLHVYGPTESTTYASWFHVEQVPDGAGTVPIGYPLANTVLHVLDERLNPVPVGMPGELLIGGDGLARGYVNRPDLTADRFVPNPFAKTPGERLYKTGDLVRYRADGAIEFIGRIDNQVKIRGFRVELGEIEQVLLEHPLVQQAVVVAPLDGAGTRRVVAYVVPRATANGGAVNWDSIRAHTRERLPEYMVPSAFVELAAIPVTPNGKVDRRALPEVQAERQLSESFVAPRSALESQVAAVWREVLGIQQVGIRDNFFDLGGHSLLLMKVHANLLEALGRELPIVALFEHPTIEALARHLDREQEQRAVVAEARERARKRGQKETADRGVAIVGMAGRFPGAHDVEAFWTNLRNGVESISFFTDEELVAAGVPKAWLEDPNYVKARGSLEGADLFDAALFGYTPREAQLIDPQQRVFLECAWEALERAGYDPERFAGLIGVYAGATGNTYVANLRSNRALLASVGTLQTITGSGGDFLPTRASYKLNLRGPSVNVQTACSTSLVAIHQACQALNGFECDVALAGGASITVPLKAGHYYQEEGIVSPDGHCRAFDARAQGTVGGSGVGVVALKRLADAIADGDVIHAVIRGTAINNDGSLKVGYTAPSVEGQAEVIALAQAVAGVEPEDITYIEAHGTGTALGDPIEIAALNRAFGGGGSRKRRSCAIGSLKSNVGHLDAAAGVAGVVKTAMALKHRELPPSLHFERPNPQIDFESSPFFVNDRLRPWDVPAGAPRRAGVSSFGIGGTNAHVVLEEAPAPGPSDRGRASQLFVLSAKTSTALDAMTANLREFFIQHPDTNLADAAYTLQVGRKVLAHRRMLVCGSVEEATAILSSGDERQMAHAVRDEGRPSLVFMFSGQGAQYAGMARALYESEAVFRQEVDRCCDLLAKHLDLDLRELLYPSEARAAEAKRLLDQTRFTQPALFVTEYALAQLWASWGIVPAAMIGHSIGEYVAACCAGVFSLEEALPLVAARGRLVGALPEGSMLAVDLSEQDVRPMLDESVAIAAVNSSLQCVVSGPHDAIATLERALAARGANPRALATSHAFHSPMMAPALRDFESELRKVRLRAPAVPFVSNVTGTWIREDQATDPAYWVTHLRETVRFSEGLDTLLEDPDRVLLEVGPGQTLASLAKRHPRRSASHVVLSTLGHQAAGKSDGEAITGTLGQLWLAGSTPDWAGVHGGERRRRVELPTYPFERQRYWVDMQSGATAVEATSAMAGRPVDDWFTVPSWKRSPLTRQAVLDVTSPWLIFEDDCGIGEELARQLASRGARAILVSAAGRFDEISADRYAIDPREPADYERLIGALLTHGGAPGRIVHLWSVTRDSSGDLSASARERAHDLGCFSVTRLVQALNSNEVTDRVDLTVVSNDIQDVTGQERLRPEKSTVLGPCLVIPREHPHVSCRAIDVALDAVPPADAVQRIAAAVLAEAAAAPSDNIVALRGGHRWVQMLEPVALSRAESASARLRDRGVYLITGGLGGVGLELAAYLAKSCRARLLLVGRSGVPSQDRWSEWMASHPDTDPVSRKIRRLQAIQQAGAELQVAAVDVADEAGMRQAVARAVAAFGAFNGVIHAAGVPGGAILQRLTPELASPVFAPKIDGTIVLDTIFKETALDFFVLCSSLVSYLPLAGRAEYTAANVFVDCFARKAARERAGVTAINWATWREVGMAADAVAERGGAGERALHAGMLSRDGVDAFARILDAGLPQVVVSPQPLAPVATTDSPRTGVASEAEPAPVASAAPSAYPRPALKTAYEAPRTPTEETLAAIWRQLLGIDQIGVHDDFFELGGDSVVSVQIIAQARQAGFKLTPRQVFECKTIAELADVVQVATPAAAKPDDSVGEVPLTPIQHWFFEQNFEEAHHFNQSAIFEVHDRIDEPVLQRAAAALVAHHDALRLRYSKQGERWLQRIDAPAADFRVDFVDLSGLSEDAQRARVTEEASSMQAGLDLVRGPIAKLAYFDFGAGRGGRLVAIVHHLAVDVVSWRILVEDLASALDQARRGRRVELPAKTASLKEWATQLATLAHAPAVEDELGYWLRLEERGVRPLPHDQDTGDALAGSVEAVATTLTREETRALLTEAPRAYNTQINDLLLAALAQSFSGWTGGRSLLVDVEGHGRHAVAGDLDVSRTVGWFTTMYPVLLELPGDRECEATITAIKEQVRAIPQHGMGYGLLRYVNRRPEVARVMSALPVPEVLFLYLGQFDQGGQQGGLLTRARESAGRDTSPSAKRHHLVEISAFVADGRLQLQWVYSPQRHRRETIARLADQFTGSLNALVEHCVTVEARRYTPSDFPEAGLDQGALDDLVQKLARTQDQNR
jgi:amino acid adenylation domain-containing protein/non-ribosomal peptide synthase protein (TIGR01720 family)